jgi:hypothetical protein
MRSRLAMATAAGVFAVALPAVAAAHPGSHDGRHGGHRSFATAVYGDAPYGVSPTDTSQTDATPGFIDAVNADPDVSTVIHVGDIHSGKQYCTESYDRTIAALWSHYADPLVYTPGDNEWTDCHKAGEGGGTYDPATGQITYVTGSDGQPVDYAVGDPLANLDLLRSIFFPAPGRTLGSGRLTTLSQADVRDRRHPQDRQYVENVMWQQQGLFFVTVNLPGGSNDDTDPWYGAPLTQAQQDESQRRTAADLRWLDLAFDRARHDKARGVVVVEQADIWALDGKTSDHLTQYEPIVKSLADHTRAFGRPVLLFEGDSHVYRSDNPLQQGAPCTGDAGVCSYDAWQSHPFYDVSNFHRVVVHGSTFPLEWLKLTVTPGAHAPTTDTTFGPFSWQRMPVG